VTDSLQPSRVWVIGRGGLLGAHVASAVTAAGHEVIDGPAIPWQDPGAASAALEAGLDRFLGEVGDASWGILWCAGAGVTNTSRELLDLELRTFRSFVSALALRLNPERAVRGRFFLASSAGGAYGGSSEPPFTEHSRAAPASPYGETKLAMEEAVREAVVPASVPTLIGRIANLYGPGQNLAKGQGLISQLCAASASGGTVPLFADLGTLRDYVYAADCGAMIVAALWGRDGEAIADTPSAEPVVKILCSGEATSIQGVLDAFQAAFGVAAPVAITPPTPGKQTLDLRLSSVVGAHLSRYARTPLVEGMRRVMASVPQQNRNE